jgi:hypothetical protein
LAALDDIQPEAPKVKWFIEQYEENWMSVKVNNTNRIFIED